MSESTTRGRRWIAAVTIAVALAVVAYVWLHRKRTPPNLLLITIDTLRADRVGAYGDARGTTPVLDGLAKRGSRFENVQTPVPMTGPAHATILTGLEPPVHGLRDNELLALDPRHATLASILKSHGYQTAAFVGGYPVTSRFGFGVGFETFHERFTSSGTERPADQVADDALAWISAAREPFFAWVHFFDPHDPYAPPQPYRERFPPYEGEIAFTDAQVGRLLAALDARRPTLVAALADHGEGLGQHDEATHGILVYESTLRVPWILAGPGVSSGGVVRERAGTLDVFPTLLSLLAIPAPKGLVGIDRRPALEGQQMGPGTLYGESLLGRLACRWAALRSWTEGDWKLIAGAEVELYDLASDPGETRNRASSEEDRVARMRRGLASALERMATGGDRLKGASLSPEQEERLRSLGYLSGSAGSTAIDEPGQPDPRTRVKDYAMLQELVGHADDPGAVEKATALAARDEGNPAAHFTLGLLAQRHRNHALAARAMERTVELDPRPTVRDAYGRLLREMGRLPESERQLRLALDAPGPYATRLRINLAETLLALGRSGDARKLVADALQADRNNAQAMELNRRLILERFNQ